MITKSFEWWRRKWWQTWLALAILFVVGILTVGAPRVFALWGLKATEPSFADARGVTAAWESQADGMDPLVHSPRDPWQRPFNYPRIWLFPGLIGWDQSQTTAIGYALMACFFFGWLVFPPGDIGWRGILCMLAIGLSPANILGMERGNIDLLMFALLAMAVPAVARGTVGGNYMAIMAVFTGFVLKLYPLAGAAVFLYAGKRGFLISTGILGVLAAGYIALTLDDLRLISQATPRATGLSYGRDVLWMELQTHGPLLGQVGRLASFAGIVVAFILLVYGWVTRPRIQEEGDKAKVEQVAFFAGAAVYCGTFVLGNNWDYRLVFLLFCMPRLAGMWRDQEQWSRWAGRFAVACIVLSCWHITIFQTLGVLPGGGPACVLMDETGNWGLFLVLCWLTGRSLPEWLGWPWRADRTGNS